MFLSRFLFARTPVLAGLVVTSLLWAGRPASAQQPLGAVSKFDRANAGAALPGWQTPWYQQAPVAARAAVPVTPPPYRWTGPLVVTVTAPTQAAPSYVDLRGPDGEVQHFALESGPTSIRTREVIVRRGESATFRFAVATPPK